MLHWLALALTFSRRFVWILLAIDVARGVRKLPDFGIFRRSMTLTAPRYRFFSLLATRRRKLPGAIDTFLALDYPRYEVVAVNDRSEDCDGRNSGIGGAEKMLG